MRADFLLHSDTARGLYESVRGLPIYDYHCHLSPKEIWEDKPFRDITNVMLDSDHYKWRLMRSAGVPEELITGHLTGAAVSDEERFRAYAGALEGAAGNPLYHWTHMELGEFFGIETPLTADNASAIRAEANARLAEGKLSPRSILEKERVRLVVTTDDPADSLEYHRLLKNANLTDLHVTPAFRPDKVLLLNRAGTPEGFKAYIEHLGDVCGAEIFNLSTLKEALERRMQFFCGMGCRFADIGIPYFPEKPGKCGRGRKTGSADNAFLSALAGKAVAPEDYSAFLWDMYLFLGKLCHDYNVLLQLHIAVMRNVNTRLFERTGPDCGGDTMADTVPLRQLADLLDALDSGSALPEMIVYSLNPAAIEPLCVVAGSFRGVRCGAAWWFCDHLSGIRDTLEIYARQGQLKSFFGMLTDSRSFLSYVRHDYFRRIACDLVAGWVDRGEYYGDAKALLEAISCGNARTFCTRS